MKRYFTAFLTAFLLIPLLCGCLSEDNTDTTNNGIQIVTKSDFAGQTSNSVRLSEDTGIMTDISTAITDVPTALPDTTAPILTTEVNPQTTDSLSETTERIPATDDIPTLDCTILLKDLTQTVQPGKTATVSIIGKPNTVYSIKVRYKSGNSKAKGLENKVSDTDGYVSWSWKVGSKTAAGEYPIVISGGGESTTFRFSVSG